MIQELKPEKTVCPSRVSGRVLGETGVLSDRAQSQRTCVWHGALPGGSTEKTPFPGGWVLTGSAPVSSGIQFLSLDQPGEALL